MRTVSDTGHSQAVSMCECPTTYTFPRDASPALFSSAGASLRLTSRHDSLISSAPADAGSAMTNGNASLRHSYALFAA